MTVQPNNERYSRQRGIVPPERIASCRATVIGVGAIGRQVALQLTAMGIAWLQLIDFDRVEPSNLASQGYLEADLGKPKVSATARLCKEINAGAEIMPIPDRFRRHMEIGNTLFCCVDSIDVRRHIWQALESRASFFVDGRMSAEVMRIITTYNAESRQNYPCTLFRSTEAFVGACTAKSTIYCANVAAGLMIAQFTKYLRGLPIETDLQLNLLASEISVSNT